MIFESLSERLQETFKKLRGHGKLTEDDVNEAMREVRMALLEADVNFKVVKDFIKTVKERAVGQEILETLTPFESNTCTRLEELLEVLDTISSPMLLGMCDVVVPFVQGEDPADYPLRLGDRMAHLHLVDSDGGSETHLLPGEGRMDLRTLLYRFREAGYDGRATLELVTHYISDPSGAARTALEQAKELLL